MTYGSVVGPCEGGGTPNNVLGVSFGVETLPEAHQSSQYFVKQSSAMWKMSF